MKTIKGTELTIIQLKGKNYLPVQQRVLWFREEHPDWGIETECVEQSDKHTKFKAMIKNEAGRIIATAHQREDFADFKDHYAKAETAAIGRALALCGYGTQFAVELEEGERIVDAPVGQKKGLTRIPVKDNVNLITEDACAQRGWSVTGIKSYIKHRFGVDAYAKMAPDDQKSLLSTLSSLTMAEAIEALNHGAGVK